MEARLTKKLARFKAMTKGCITCNGTKQLCGHCGEASNACSCEDTDYLMDCPDCGLQKWDRSANTVAKAIGIPTNEWEGRCHEIAGLMLDKKLVKGTLCYGMFLGEIHPSSIFGKRPFTHHGWIELADKRIIDPTRWVFEHVDPYIFFGENNDEYDFGGNEIQRRTMSPCPEFNPMDRFGNPQKIFDFAKLYPSTQLVIKSIAKPNKTKLTLDQLFWLGNLPLDMLGKEAKNIYLWIVMHKQGSVIPIDNRDRILG